MIYDMIMDELNHREVYLYEIYAPPFIVSTACHLFNIFNYQHKVYYEGGKIPHYVLHLCFTAPAGFMKSFIQDQFIGDEYSILSGTEIPTAKFTEVTSAGLVGSTDPNKWTRIAEEVPGLLDDYKYGIIATEEFDALTLASKKDYNSNLEHHLLTVLDKGVYYKRTKYGEKKDKVFTTFWVANQPERQVDVSSGIARRFLHLLYVPTPQEFDVFSEKWWSQKNVKPSDSLVVIRDRLNNFRNLLKLIRRVEFDDSVKRFYDKHELVPHECILLDRYILGYTIARYGVDETLVLTVDDKDLKEQLERLITWREQITFGADLIQLYYIIRSANNEGIEIRKLYRLITKLNLKVDNVNKYLTKLRQLGFVKVAGGKVYLQEDLWKDKDHQ